VGGSIATSAPADQVSSQRLFQVECFHPHPRPLLAPGVPIASGLGIGCVGSAGRTRARPRGDSRRHSPLFAMRLSTTSGSTRVDVSPIVSISSVAMLRRIRLMILPERVFGSAGRSSFRDNAPARYYMLVQLPSLTLLLRAWYWGNEILVSGECRGRRLCTGSTIVVWS
jgi:hypothetical protein